MSVIFWHPLKMVLIFILEIKSSWELKYNICHQNSFSHVNVLVPPGKLTWKSLFLCVTYKTEGRTLRLRWVTTGSLNSYWQRTVTLACRLFSPRWSVDRTQIHKHDMSTDDVFMVIKLTKRLSHCKHPDEADYLSFSEMLFLWTSFFCVSDIYIRSYYITKNRTAS